MIIPTVTGFCNCEPHLNRQNWIDTLEKYNEQFLYKKDCPIKTAFALLAQATLFLVAMVDKPSLAICGAASIILYTALYFICERTPECGKKYSIGASLIASASFIAVIFSSTIVGVKVGSGIAFFSTCYLAILTYDQSCVYQYFVKIIQRLKQDESDNVVLNNDDREFSLKELQEYRKTKNVLLFPELILHSKNQKFLLGFSQFKSWAWFSNKRDFKNFAERIISLLSRNCSCSGIGVRS